MRNYIFSLTFIFLCSFLSWSQNRSSTFEGGYNYSFESDQVLDTVTYSDPPGALFFATVGGYVCGTNGYGDLGKYQRFDLATNYFLTGSLAVFGEKGVVGDADQINFVVKEVGQNGEPGATIFTASITTNDIDTTNFTSIAVDPPLSVNNSIFIGFEWSSAVDDSFGLVSDEETFGDSAYRAWEKWSDGQYYAFYDEDSWELDIDLWIAAVIETSTGVEIAAPSGFNLRQNYPNPFNPETKITFSLNAESQVSLRIFNLLGEEVMTLVNKRFSAGSHTVNFNASDLQSGVYFYEIISEDNNGATNTAVKKMLLIK